MTPAVNEYVIWNWHRTREQVMEMVAFLLRAFYLKTLIKSCSLLPFTTSFPYQKKLILDARYLCFVFSHKSQEIVDIVE